VVAWLALSGVDAGTPLELQDRSQAFIDEALQTRRQRPGTLGQEAAVKGQELGDIHDRVAGEAHRTGRQQDIPWGVGEFNVAGDHSYDCRLNPAAIERVRLNHEDRPPESRLGAARLGKIRPPDLPSLNLAHLYQASFERDFS